MSAPGPTLPLTLRTSRAKMLLLLGVCAMFVAGGLVVAERHPLEGYGGVVFFGLGVIVAVVNLLPGSSYLVLDDSGFTVFSSFRKTRYAWADIAEFTRVEMGLRSMVGLRFEEHYRQATTMRKVATALAGAEGALPDTYGMKTDALVALLNELRQRQVKRP